MMENPFDAIPDVDFAPKEVNELLAEMIADYEAAYLAQTGERKIVEPSTPERIFLYTEALRFYTAYQLIDRGCKMNLLKYSQEAYLDNLAAMVGEARLPAQKAVTMLQFSLSVPMRSVVVIPAGTRVTSLGKLYFETTADLLIPVGETKGECAARACEAGARFSGLQAGEINTIVDPVPYVADVRNVEVTQGGVDVETDDGLRLRVYMKPKSFSVAGPQAAYQYFIQAYSQAIEGISVTSPTPGDVDIRVTLQGGELPAEAYLDGLIAYLEDKRPLTDRVRVCAPDVIEFALKCTYYIARSCENRLSVLCKEIEAAAKTYLNWQSTQIGRDLTPDMLTRLMIGAGAKRLMIDSPVYQTVVPTAICKCNHVEIIFGGVEDD